MTNDHRRIDGKQSFSIQTGDGFSGTSLRRPETSEGVSAHLVTEAGGGLGASVPPEHGSSQGPIWSSLQHDE